MLPFLRSSPTRTQTAHLNPLFYESGRSSVHFTTTTDNTSSSSPTLYTMTHTLPPASISTFLAPPLHIHLYQRESFRILAGTGAFYLRPALHPAATLLHKDETIEIPPGAPHRFENGDRDEKLVVAIGLDPARPGRDEAFFRNFFGYLEDCRVQGVQPSVLQLLVFLRTVDGPLAVPLPGWVPEWVGGWVSWGLLVLGAAVGRWGVGYRGCYGEYYQAEGGNDV